MTPAEHYAEAERLIGLSANETSPQVKDRLIATAGVHATLATVDRAVSRQAEVKEAGGVIRSTPDPDCTCPRLSSSPVARTSTDPACPIHGGT